MRFMVKRSAVMRPNEPVASIRRDADDPFSQGYICPKATALQDPHEDESRLRHPVRRTPTGVVVRTTPFSVQAGTSTVS